MRGANIVFLNNSTQSANLNRPITITIPPSFAAKWLVPRLKSFRSLHSGIEVRIDTLIEVVDLARIDIDVGIRFGLGDYPGMQVDLLMHQEVFPVCSPDLINKSHPLNQPSDLQFYEILQFDERAWKSDWPGWQMWLMAAGAGDVEPRSGMTFNQQELLIQAAIDGHGVALVGSVAVNDDIENGRLIKPFEQTYPLKLAYYFVTSQGKGGWPDIVAIRNWVFDEVSNIQGI